MRALEFLWLTAAVAVPLLVNPWGQNGFELPKAALLRTLVLLMGLAALVRGSQPGGAREPRRLLAFLWPALALGLAFVLATVLSTNPRVSLWGSYERQQGLLTLGSYLALFCLTAANLRARAAIERLWAALVWGSAPAVVYGLVQAAGVDPLGWQTDASPVLSTMGRANFFGSYLALVAPLTVGRAALARRRWPYTLLLAAQLICLVLTGARAAWVGLGVAVVAALLARAAATRDRRPALAALALAVLAVGLVALLGVDNGPLASLARLPGLDRLAALTDTAAGSTAARLAVWRATLPLVAARPWLGYGPETMRTVFARVFPPQLVYYQGRHVAVDRAHNLWLDLGMSAGLAGVAAFGVLLARVGRTAWRGLRGSAGGWERAAWTALAAAITGHLADVQFGFNLTAGATVFWLVLAMAAALGRAPQIACHDSAEPDSPSPRAGRGLGGGVGTLRRLRLWVIAGRLRGGLRESWLEPPSHRGERQRWGVALYTPAALLVLVLVGLVCVRPLLADVAYRRSRDTGCSPGDQLVAALQAVRLWPLEPAYRLGLAWSWAGYGDLAAAEAQLATAERLDPGDPALWVERGNVYASWGESAPELYVQAEGAYRRALELAPDVATTHTALGLVLARQGRLEEGLAHLERAVALDATDGVAYRRLADLYRALGWEADAARAEGEAERWSENP